jgi:hypothetical protein
MLTSYIRQNEVQDIQHLSTADLRQRAAAILKSGRGLDGVDEVIEILDMIRARYRDARTPHR